MTSAEVCPEEVLKPLFSCLFSCFGLVPWVAPKTNNHSILHLSWSLLVKIGYTQNFPSLPKILQILQSTQEVFGFPNNYSQGIWQTSGIYIYIHIYTTKLDPLVPPYSSRKKDPSSPTPNRPRAVEATHIEYPLGSTPLAVSAPGEARRRWRFRPRVGTKAQRPVKVFLKKQRSRKNHDMKLMETHEKTHIYIYI